MNKPELYGTTNKTQKGISVSTLADNAHKLKWNKKQITAIDIGCGDGGLSVFLKNKLPCSYKRYVACDISEEMINYAKMRHASEDVSFIRMDVAGEISEGLKGAFNHVYSFYTLHWVKDQEKAFRNIYNLMEDEGDVFLTFLGTSAIYNAYAELAHLPKWQSLLERVNIFIGPYHENKNTKKDIAEIMAKCGFKDIDITCKKITNVYDSVKDVKDFIRSVEPFDMPNVVAEEFVKDYITVSLEMGVMWIDGNNDKHNSFVTHDELIVVYASK